VIPAYPIGLGAISENPNVAAESLYLPNNAHLTQEVGIPSRLCLRKLSGPRRKLIRYCREVCKKLECQCICGNALEIDQYWRVVTWLVDVLRCSSSSHAANHPSAQPPMLMSRRTTYLVEAGNIGRGGAICIDSDPIVNQVRDLERVAYSGSSCAWLEAIAMLGLDIHPDDR
jgi:hypothetical protein